MSKIPVSALYEYCEMMLHDKWGYIWGTAGVKCTQATINTAIDRHPSTADITKKYGPKWLGHIVTDCSGVMVYIWGKFGKTIPHGSSSMVSKKYIVDCSDTPYPGYAALVDPTPETDDNNHIGIVSKDGKYVYEAKGTQYGFVKSELKKTKFNKFGRFSDVAYDATDDQQEEDPMDASDTMYLATVTTKSGRLHMRAGPGTSYQSILMIPKGETVEVLAEYDTGWDCIRYDNRIGYASAEFLTPINAPESAQDRPQNADEETPTDPETPCPTPTYTDEWGVYVPCDNEQEARRYASNIKNAVILHAAKPPDADKND